MWSEKRAPPFKASKDTLAVASKIKHKILNTSSFFKVSLKTNNRALALALEAQKERRGQLEREVVYLQKQVEALCFELAARKYRHRKLLHLLKVLHSETLERLSNAAELLSDLECPEQSEDHRSRPADVHSDVRGRSFWLRDPVWAEVPVLNANSTAWANQTCRRDAAASGHENQSVRYDEGTDPPTSCRSSVSLRAGEGELPVKLQDKTVLLNATMEMTVCNAAEIVTVETTAKGKTVKKQGRRDAETQDAESVTDHLPPEDIENPAVPECPLPDTQVKRPTPSRIPKPGFRQDRVKPPAPLESSSGRLKVKKASSVNRESIFIPSADHTESSQSSPSAQPPPETVQPCEDEEGRPESGPVPSFSPGSSNPETGFRAVNFSRGSHRSRCRSTFFVVSDDTSSDRALQGRDPIRPAGSSPNTLGRPDNGTKSPKSWKRPRAVVQEPCGVDGLDAPPLPTDQQSTKAGLDVQTRKRARREEAARSSKTKPEHRKGRGQQEQVKTKTKKKVCPKTLQRADHPEVSNPPSSSSQTSCPSPDIGQELQCFETTPDGGWSSSVGRVGLPDSCAEDAVVHGRTGDLLIDELPPWLGMDDTDLLSSPASGCGTETQAAGVLDSSSVLVETEHGAAVQLLHGTVPAGRVLTILTNTVTVPGGETPGRTKRSHQQVSYKEPPLNRKMRREDFGQNGKKKRKTAVKAKSTKCPVKDWPTV